jgi:hypothetical protein
MNEEPGALIRRFTARREAERKAARFKPDGSLALAVSDNARIAEGALVREPVPNSHGAEFWISYSGARDDFLRLRDDPATSQFAASICNPDALNGYVAFPKRAAPRLPPGTGNIVQYIPVHGGVTWARKDSYMAVWGFDTMHVYSERQPRTDKDWIRANCWLLYRGLLLAAKRWPEFRRASQRRRAEMVEELLDLVGEQPLMEKLGFEAMVGMFLGGRIG